MKSPSRHILQQVVDLSPEAVLLLDARDSALPIVYVNSAYERLSGFAASDLIGTGWRLLDDADETNPSLADLRRALDCGDPCVTTVLDVRKDGESWFSRLSLHPIHDTRGELRFFLCQQRDASESEADLHSSVKVDLLERELGHARQRLASLCRTDPVTGLLSYEYFLTLLRRDLGISRRERRLVSILLFEVVELETYQATFGSNAADSCLRMIGTQVAGVFRRAGDLCARRDDKLVVVSTRGLDLEQAQAMADRVAEKVRGIALHNPRAKSGKYLSVRSVVDSQIPDGEDADELIERIRQGLYPDGERLLGAASR